VYDFNNLKKLSDIGKLDPQTMEAFRLFDAEALADGVIPKKYKELMALAVALTTQCSYCLEAHRRAAKKAGATDEELAETVFIAAALRAGAALTHGTHLFLEK
jgi:AhpD family alkylhydroperoxidase